jgi:hypothetical protein
VIQRTYGVALLEVEVSKRFRAGTRAAAVAVSILGGRPEPG